MTSITWADAANEGSSITSSRALCSFLGRCGWAAKTFSLKTVNHPLGTLRRFKRLSLSLLCLRKAPRIPLQTDAW